MISSARSRVAAPSASAESASASRCRAPVSTAPTASPSTAASGAVSGPDSAWTTPPTAAPIAAPTNGTSAAPRATSAASSWIRRPTGTRVRNATAAARPRSSAAGIGDAGAGERRHLLENGDRRAEERQCKRCARSLAKPKSEVEQRLDAERVEHERVSRLRGAVGGDEHLGRRGVDGDGGERGGAGDEPVEEDDDPSPRTAEDEPGEEGDLEATERSQRVFFVVELDRSADRVDLVRQADVVQARAAAADERGVHAEERGGERACGRRISDPHLTEPHDVDLSELVCERRAGIERTPNFGARHRRPVEHVRGAGTDADGSDELVLERGRNPGVDEHEPGAGIARQHVDRGAA